MVFVIKPEVMAMPTNVCVTFTPETKVVISPPVAPGAVPPIKLPEILWPPLEFTVDAKLMLIALVIAPLTVCVRVAVW